MFDQISILRLTRRRIRIFFGGDTSREQYSNPELRRRYGQMPRAEGVDAVLEMGGSVKKVDDLREFLKVMEGDSYKTECYLLGANGVGQEKWLELLAKSDFFICFSGTDMPMCHNTVEAMSVGAIPIISYQDWFFPVLEHRKNAIVYKGNKEDLQQKIREVFAMKEEEILKMRQNVIDYYEQHLRNERFFQEFEANTDKVCTVMLHPRLVCSEQENAKGNELLNELDSILRAMVS